MFFAQMDMGTIHSNPSPRTDLSPSRNCSKNLVYHGPRMFGRQRFCSIVGDRPDHHFLLYFPLGCYGRYCTPHLHGYFSFCLVHVAPSTCFLGGCGPAAL